MNAIAVIIGLAFANFGYQLLQVDPQFIIAAERTFFQGVAIAAYLFCNTFIQR